MTATAIAAKSVLVVEDDAVQRENLAHVLVDHGYSVRQARTGKGMFDFLRKEKPDLILLDMLLPEGEDGWAVLARMHQNARWTSIPVIIMTAIGVASEQWARSLGAVTFLHKPFEDDELLSKVAAALFRWKAETAAGR